MRTKKVWTGIIWSSLSSWENFLVPSSSASPPIPSPSPLPASFLLQWRAFPRIYFLPLLHVLFPPVVVSNLGASILTPSKHRESLLVGRLGCWRSEGPPPARPSISSASRHTHQLQSLERAKEASFLISSLHFVLPSALASFSISWLSLLSPTVLLLPVFYAYHGQLLSISCFNDSHVIPILLLSVICLYVTIQRISWPTYVHIFFEMIPTYRYLCCVP